jgi:hypothetical protein
VSAIRICRTSASVSGIQRELCAKHCGQPHRSSRFGKANDTIETIMVSDGKGLESKTICLIG